VRLVDHPAFDLQHTRVGIGGEGGDDRPGTLCVGAGMGTATVVERV
jgi:hypothetical protein